MRARVIFNGRFSPLDESGILGGPEQALPLPVGWVERLSESHQFRLFDRVLFCPGPTTCPSIALPIVGMRRTARRVEYQIRCRDGYRCWVPESLLRRVR